jgi:hypothetical protein
MKTLIPCLLLLTVFACKEKLDLSCDANFLEADVNGLQWDAMKVVGFKSAQYTVSAEANYGTLRQLDFKLPANIKTGDFDLAPTAGTGVIVYPGGFFADGGKLNLTVVDTVEHILKGSFELSADFGNLIVKDGSFCVKYSM